MAVDFIAIDLTSSQGTLLKQYINTLRSAYEIGARVAGIMNHNNDGTTFAPIETLFGVKAGSGQTVFNLVNGSTGAMNGLFQNTDCKTITEQVG
jgi:hypothetical protein